MKKVMKINNKIYSFVYYDKILTIFFRFATKYDYNLYI